MNRLVFILAFSLSIICCHEQSKNKHESPPSTAELPKQDQDSLVLYYEQTILDYYNQADTNDYEIELELTGRRAYEDDSILILTFDEILKFGSWHYTNSSLCFLKDGNSLIPIPPSLPIIKVLDDDFHERELQYPNRINGTFQQRTDLTGNGKLEYIFHSTGAIRTSIEERYNIYQFDSIHKCIHLSNLSISGHGTQGECDTTFGTLSTFKIIRNALQNPVIEIKTTTSTCNHNTLSIKELSHSFSYFTWDEGERQFKNLPSFTLE